MLQLPSSPHVQTEDFKKEPIKLDFLRIKWTIKSLVFLRHLYFECADLRCFSARLDTNLPVKAFFFIPKQVLFELYCKNEKSTPDQKTMSLSDIERNSSHNVFCFKDGNFQLFQKVFYLEIKCSQFFYVLYFQHLLCDFFIYLRELKLL